MLNNIAIHLIDKRIYCDNDPQTVYSIINKWIFVNARLWLEQYFITGTHAE